MECLVFNEIFPAAELAGCDAGCRQAHQTVQGVDFAAARQVSLCETLQ
jgi:hypothetical protein